MRIETIKDDLYTFYNLYLKPEEDPRCRFCLQVITDGYFCDVDKLLCCKVCAKDKNYAVCPDFNVFQFDGHIDWHITSIKMEGEK